VLAERWIFQCQGVYCADPDRLAGHYNGGEAKADEYPMDDRSRLNTFLRGIEPRAWVFLHLHCGDPAGAAALFRDTLSDFADVAAGEPLARWPMRFWKILLAQPGLATESEGHGEGGLARMPPGPRVVFLLPMVAGLDEVHATEALGISSHALARALVRARVAWPDAEAHERLRELVQARIRQPTEADRKSMEALRAEALGHDEGVVATPTGTVPPRPVRWPRRPVALAVLALLVVLALVWWGRSHWSGRPPSRLGQVEALPTESVPPPPTLDAAMIVTHPDYLILASPGDAGLARDLALLSWFDAEASSEATTSATAMATAAQDPAPAASDFAAMPDAEQALLASARATWPNLDPETRERLQLQAADWLRRTPAEHDALRQGVLAWDRSAIAERARRRAPFEAWLQLSEDDRHRLRAAALRWSSLPAPQQADARSRFAALPADAQRLWWLGPNLGRELAPVVERFAFLPEAQRDAFLATLRGLDGGGRADFIRLSERMEPAERERLRQDLQAQAPERRNAWLRTYLAR
jgi:hypothetical protein